MSLRKVERYLRQANDAKTRGEHGAFDDNVAAALKQLLMEVRDHEQFIATASSTLWPTLERKMTETKTRREPCSVLQDWVQRLTFMQQTVLVTAMRGPDGIDKNHSTKPLLKWLRRCVLYSAFESAKHKQPFAFVDPYTPGGGKFTGPHLREQRIPVPGGDAVQILNFGASVEKTFEDYVDSLDAVPHHFQLHFMHAVEIVGYHHPVEQVRAWWNKAYVSLARTMHLNPETQEQLDKRLGDDETDWRAFEQAAALPKGD